MTSPAPVRYAEKSVEPLNFEGQTVGSCGALLLTKLLEVVTFRSKTTGSRSKSALFPLPTSRSMIQQEYKQLTEDEITWLVLVCVSLNSLWGDEIFYEGVWNGAVKSCMDNVVKEVVRFYRLPAVVPPLSWEELFKVRGVDYKGEEVKVLGTACASEPCVVGGCACRVRWVGCRQCT